MNGRWRRTPETALPAVHWPRREWISLNTQGCSSIGRALVSKTSG